MQSALGMFFNHFFLNIYNYLEQKEKKNVTNRIDLQFASFQKCYINKTHIYKYLFFINI